MGVSLKAAPLRSEGDGEWGRIVYKPLEESRFIETIAFPIMPRRVEAPWVDQSLRIWV